MNLTLLYIIAIAEAIVYQGRYRATHGSPLAAGLWTLAVCGLRVGFVWLGASSAMKGEAWWAVLLAYAVPAAVVTSMVRAREIRKDGRSNERP